MWTNMSNRCVVYALCTRTCFDDTSGNNLIDSEKVHNDEIFERQDVLHIFSRESIGYESVKYPTMT